MATFTTFTSGDTVDSIDRVFTSAWSGNTNDLGTSHFSSSTQYVTTSPTSSGAFYMDIFDKNPQTDDTAEIQYAIAYGHIKGSGSQDFSTGAGATGFSTRI